MAFNSKTAWPTSAEVRTMLTAAGVPIRSGVTSTFDDEIIASVVGDLQLKTHRQFIADTVASSRDFNGSGAGEQIIDDLVELTSVTILGWAGVAQFDVTNAVMLEQDSYPLNKLVLAKGPAYQFVYGTFTRFPEGRSNIQVLAKWGFGTYIPDNVWEAVRGKAASVLANYFTADANTGRVIQSWIDGSSAEKYREGSVGETNGWDRRYDQVKSDYYKPPSNRLRPLNKVMI